MNKYVEKVEQYKEKVLKPALEKLKAEHEEAEDSNRGILQHFNSYGMRQSLNELYLQEMGKPYPEPEKKPDSKCGLFCGYYGSTDDYIKQPEEKEVTDSGSNTDA